MIKTGIFGGTFSPPHIGHLNAATCFVKKMNLDELLVVPAKIPPHKDPLECESPDKRKKMAELAFSNLPRVTVSDIELKREGKSYTYLTLKELALKDRQLFLLVGTDMFLTLDTWKNPDIIFSLSTVVCAGRIKGTEIEEEIKFKKNFYEQTYNGRIYLLDNPIFELSSSDLREDMKKGIDVSDKVPASVLSYIREEGLYS